MMALSSNLGLANMHPHSATVKRRVGCNGMKTRECTELGFPDRIKQT